jgi:hypothetical protein
MLASTAKAFKIHIEPCPRRLRTIDNEMHSKSPEFGPDSSNQKENTLVFLS